MPSTMPLRIGDDLLSSARVAAEATGRSTAQQVGYWAKLGRELERSGSVSARGIAEVLAGARAYDELDPKAQAVVRAEWSERIDASLATLDLTGELAAEGRSWVELAPDGTTIRHPAPRKRPARKAPVTKKATATKKVNATKKATAARKVAAITKAPARKVAAQAAPRKAAATTAAKKVRARSR